MAKALLPKPDNRALTCATWGALGGIRTPNLLIRRSEQQTVSSWGRVKHGLRGCPDGGSCGPVGVRLGSAGKLPHNRLGSIERGPGAGPPEHDRWSVSARRVTVVDLI